MSTDATGLKVCDECGGAFYDWLGTSVICEDCEHVLNYTNINPSGTGEVCHGRQPKLM